jgi:hypothetical protein
MASKEALLAFTLLILVLVLMLMLLLALALVPMSDGQGLWSSFGRCRMCGRGSVGRSPPCQLHWCWTLVLADCTFWLEVVRGGAHWNGLGLGFGFGERKGRPCGSTARCPSPGNRSTHTSSPAPSYPCHPLWIQARPIHPGRRNWKCSHSPSNVRQPIRRPSRTTHLPASAQVPERRFSQS